MGLGDREEDVMAEEVRWCYIALCRMNVIVTVEADKMVWWYRGKEDRKFTASTCNSCNQFFYDWATNRS
jgi:hypothetical protein